MDNKPNEIMINQAAQWYARLHAPDCSEAERDAFKVWLAGGSGREQAYRSVIDAARRVSDQLGADPRMRAMLENALNQPVPAVASGFGTRFRYAAAVVLFVGIAAFFTFGRQQAFHTDPTAFYVNTEAGKQRIELNDGSVVYLDVGAKLSVTMGAHQRRLELETGRAFFEVAHDKSRPFSVSKAGTSVVALGTRFQVEVMPSEQTINVTLAEGSVAVSNVADVDNWREVLVPGQQLLVNNALRYHEITQVNTDAVTSWSTGFLVFDGMPLRKALDEVNRYTKVKVVLGDGSLANIPIAGNFMAGGDSEAFVATLTTVLPLRSARTGANEIVLFHKYETNN